MDNPKVSSAAYEIIILRDKEEGINKLFSANSFIEQIFINVNIIVSIYIWLLSKHKKHELLLKAFIHILLSKFSFYQASIY